MSAVLALNPPIAELTAPDPSCRTCNHSRGTSQGGLFCTQPRSVAYGTNRNGVPLEGHVIRYATRSEHENLANDQRCEEFARRCRLYQEEV